MGTGRDTAGIWRAREANARSARIDHWPDDRVSQKAHPYEVRYHAFADGRIQFVVVYCLTGGLEPHTLHGARGAYAYSISGKDIIEW